MARRKNETIEEYRARNREDARKAYVRPTRVGIRARRDHPLIQFVASAATQPGKSASISNRDVTT